jgi:putative LysE/RhtB family amino acid efflux pump
MLFLKAVLMGLAIAAPLGPIGALCIQRTLERGLLAGVAGGLGTALADALYASLAAAGFAAFAAALDSISTPLGLIGGGFLLWLAWKGWPRGTAAPKAAASPAVRGVWLTTATTFALTIANPATILSFAAIFAGIGLADTASTASAAAVVAGVFAGSMLWWIMLSGTVAALHHRLPASFAHWVARASSLMMAGFGLWAVSSAVI